MALLPLLAGEACPSCQWSRLLDFQASHELHGENAMRFHTYVHGML